MNFKCNKKIYILIALIILIIYLLPYIILWENSHIQVYDNLDFNVGYKEVLADSGLIFGSMDSVIPNFLNGIPRNVLSSELDIKLLFNFLFPPYAAYVLNLIIIHTVAFFGMYLLLNTHFTKGKELILITIGVSLCFSLLPFWPPGGLSVAGLPLTLYAFLNIRSGSFKFWDFLILFFIPFYSNFSVSYIFLLFLIFLLWIIDYIRTKKSNYKFLLSIIFMTAIFLIVEYRLIYEMFFNQEYISHRTEWVLTHYSIRESLNVAIRNYIFGHYHAHSLQQYFVGISVLISIVVMAVKKKIDKTLIFLLSISLIISLWYGFFRWEGMLYIKDKISLFNYFNLSRFHWLHPLLWYITFALALVIIIRYLRFGKYIVIFLLILQIVFLFYNNSEFVERRSDAPTYKQFYSVSMFEEIKETIDKDQKDYRVASIGLHPSVAIYNGFYTIDGFYSNYPLEHKHNFRKIIEKELEKNEVIKDYFDDQADRCYIMVSEIGRNFMIDKYSSIEIENLELNNSALKNFNCQYIFSSVKINNSGESGLKLIKVFEDDDSIWRIYLYEVY